MHCDVTQGTELEKLYKTSYIVILQRNEENYYWSHLVSQSVFTLRAYIWPIQTKTPATDLLQIVNKLKQIKVIKLQQVWYNQACCNLSYISTLAFAFITIFVVTNAGQLSRLNFIPFHKQIILILSVGTINRKYFLWATTQTGPAERCVCNVNTAEKLWNIFHAARMEIAKTRNGTNDNLRQHNLCC